MYYGDEGWGSYPLSFGNQIHFSNGIRKGYASYDSFASSSSRTAYGSTSISRATAQGDVEYSSTLNSLISSDAVKEKAIRLLGLVRWPGAPASQGAPWVALEDSKYYTTSHVSDAEPVLSKSSTAGQAQYSYTAGSKKVTLRVRPVDVEGQAEPPTGSCNGKVIYGVAHIKPRGLPSNQHDPDAHGNNSSPDEDKVEILTSTEYRTLDGSSAKFVGEFWLWKLPKCMK